MTEALKGKTLSEAEALFRAFRDLATGRLAVGEADGLGDLALFAGVYDFPQRVKCVTLPWHAARAALAGDLRTVSTE
jgi:nitrogen fixation NifU-like protein